LARFAEQQGEFVFVLAEWENVDLVRSSCSIPDLSLASRRFSIGVMSARSDWRSAGILSGIHVGLIFDELSEEQLDAIGSSQLFRVRSLHDGPEIDLTVCCVAVRFDGQSFADLLSDAVRQVEAVSSAQSPWARRRRDPRVWCDAERL
jgi:hypothetical protein